jgi:hypothetical protein
MVFISCFVPGLLSTSQISQFMHGHSTAVYIDFCHIRQSMYSDYLLHHTLMLAVMDMDETSSQFIILLHHSLKSASQVSTMQNFNNRLRKRDSWHCDKTNERHACDAWLKLAPLNTGAHPHGNRCILYCARG